MKLNIAQKITLGFFILLVVFWAWLFTTGTKDSSYNYLFSFLFGLPPLIGGLVSLFVSKLWGGFQNDTGKGIFFIGLGLFLWGCGEMVWVYYNFALGIPVPYPSLADLGYMPGMFLYALGSYYSAKLSHTELDLNNYKTRLFVFFSPIAVAVLAYYLLIYVARGGVLISDGTINVKSALNIIYPLGDFISLTIAVMVSGLSFPYMRGKYRFDIGTILLGVGTMFIADVIFSYTTTTGTFYNAGWADLFFMIGTSLLTFGVLGFYTLKE